MHNAYLINPLIIYPWKLDIAYIAMSVTWNFAFSPFKYIKRLLKLRFQSL